MELSTNRKIDNRKVNDTKSNRKCHLDTDVEKKRTSFHSDFKKSASYLMNDYRLVFFPVFRLCLIHVTILPKRDVFMLNELKHNSMIDL